MTIPEIKKHWIPSTKNMQAVIDWWDSKADIFASRELPTAANSLAIRLILDNQMIAKDKTALDIGCGGGRFSFALEQLGAHVTATDLSPRMIEECNKQKTVHNSSSNFYVQDWNIVDLHQLDWYQKFDLVLANMTPAICSADTFLKLQNASCEWCLIVKPIRRNNSIQDILAAKLGLEPDTTSLKDNLIYAMELLWLNNKEPKIEYEEQLRTTTCSLKDAIPEYVRKFSTLHTLSQTEKDAIAKYLQHISNRDMVTETINTTIAAIYWHI